MTDVRSAIPSAEQSARRDTAISSAWTKRLRWSDAADKFQKEVVFWRRSQTTLAIVGAVFATAAATVIPDTPILETLTGKPLPAGTDSYWALRSWENLIALVSALALGGVAGISKHFLKRELTDRWPRARSVSEGLKSEIYRFRTAVHPYEALVTAESDRALETFQKKVFGIEDLAADLAVYLEAEPKTSKSPPQPLGPHDYTEQRIDDQVKKYYQPKSRYYEALAGKFRWASIILAGVGSAISAAMTFGDPGAFGAWVAVLTTVSAALVAHSNVGRYDFLATAYAKQALRLARLKTEWETIADQSDPQAWSEFVNNCEETISAENRAWMAEITKKVEGVDEVVKKRDDSK